MSFLLEAYNLIIQEADEELAADDVEDVEESELLDDEEEDIEESFRLGDFE